MIDEGIFSSARGGLEPHFRVLFSAIFHRIPQGNCHKPGKQWNVVEAKPLQTAASLHTFFLLVIPAKNLKNRSSAFLSGILERGDANISNKIFRSMRVFRRQ